MFVEPCCAENQIPRLLRISNGHALFQTNGDVTIEKLMQAACCMASGGFGEYWICVREVDVVLMRSLRHWMNRGWIRELHLLTATDQREMAASELGEELMKHVDYGWREGLGLEAFCVVGDRESMVVQGEMLLAARTEPVMTAYSAAVGPNERMLGSEGIVGSLIENLRAVLRVSKRRKKKAKGESSGTGSADTSEATDQVPVPSDAPAEGSADHQPDGDTQPDGERTTEGLSTSVSQAPEEPTPAGQPEAVETQEPSAE